MSIQRPRFHVSCFFRPAKRSGSDITAAGKEQNLAILPCGTENRERKKRPPSNSAIARRSSGAYNTGTEIISAKTIHGLRLQGGTLQWERNCVSLF